MVTILYASAVKNLMYAQVCMRPRYCVHYWCTSQKDYEKFEENKGLHAYLQKIKELRGHCILSISANTLASSAIS